MYKPSKKLKGMILSLPLALSIYGCGAQPQLEQTKDLTGDGIPDAIVSIKYGIPNGKWLFIGQEDGTYKRAKEDEKEGVKFFRTDDGTAYFFNGKFYIPSPKQK